MAEQDKYIEILEPKWATEFWNDHGERLTFAGLALSLAAIMRFLGLSSESNTIIIGIAMLFFNKTRGGKDATKG